MSDNQDAGLYAKYEVRKDGETVENCFVLEPDGDPAARAAIKTYARVTENPALAHDLRGVFEIERTPQEEWEEHNTPFNYEPPEKPGDAWSSEEYQELYDRVISRRTEWFCDRCSGRGPISSLRKARRHVESNHGHKLIKMYETPRDEQETPTDGGTRRPSAKKRSEQNRDLGEFGSRND